jgi:hypothetical protein
MGLQRPELRPAAGGTARVLMLLLNPLAPCSLTCAVGSGRRCRRRRRQNPKP